MTLHIVNQSPEQQKAFDECLAHCAADESILLMENGVYAAVNNTPAAIRLQAHHGPVYALKNDVTARGLEPRLLDAIRLIDYPDFVDLCTEHPHILSWY